MWENGEQGKYLNNNNVCDITPIKENLMAMMWQVTVRLYKGQGSSYNLHTDSNFIQQDTNAKCYSISIPNNC